MKAIARTTAAIASLICILAGEAMAIEQAKLFRDPKGSLFLYGLQPDSEIRIGVPLSGVRRIRAGGCGIVSIKPSKRFPKPASITIDGEKVDVTKLQIEDPPKCINGVPDKERSQHFITSDDRIMIVGRNPRAVSEVFYPVESSGRIKKANGCGFLRITLKDTVLNLPTTSGTRAEFDATKAPSYPQIICKKLGARKQLYVPPQWPYEFASSGTDSNTGGTSGNGSGTGSTGGSNTGGSGTGNTGGTNGSDTPSASDIDNGNGGAAAGAYKTRGSGTGPYSNWNPPPHPDGASKDWVFLPAPAGGAACTGNYGHSVVLEVIRSAEYEANMDNEADSIIKRSNDQGVLSLDYAFDTTTRTFEGNYVGISVAPTANPQYSQRVTPAGMSSCRLWPTYNGTFIKFNPDGSTQRIQNF